MDDFLDCITNRTVPDLSDELQSAMEALCSMVAVMGSDQTSDDLTKWMG